MLEIPNKQVSFRLNEEQMQQLNVHLAELQEKEAFTTVKQAMTALLEDYTKIKQELASRPETKEVEPPKNKAELITAIGYEETPTDETLYADVLEIITTPLEPAPEVEIIKEVEVERKLSENEILVELSQEQHAILHKIARFRVQTKRDADLCDTASLMRKMIFNKGTLTNDHGRFETGIRSRHLK